MSKSSRRWFAFHAWTGLISGIFIVFLALSGAVILFYEPLSTLLNPHSSNVTKVKGQENYLPFDILAKKIKDSYPAYDFNGFTDFSPDSNQAITAYIDQYEKYIKIKINPYTAEILGEPRNKAAEWIYTFHYSFQLGKTGEWMALLFAFSLLGSIISGFVIYRKYILKMLLCKVKFSFQNWRKSSSAIHRIIGVWALVFNFIMGFTGVYLMLYLFVPENAEEIKQAKNASEYTISLDSCVRKAKQHFPDYKVNYIKTPRNPDDSLISIWGDVPGDVLLGKFATSYDYNIYTKAEKFTLESDLDGFTQFRLWLSSLHFGHFWGIFSELLYLLFALATSALSITGFLLWWRRKV